MTKIYLVTMHECDKNGIVIENGKTIVDEVFTNKSLAKAYVNYMNEMHWETKQEWWWDWTTKKICRIDLSEIVF